MHMYICIFPSSQGGGGPPYPQEKGTPPFLNGWGGLSLTFRKGWAFTYLYICIYVNMYIYIYLYIYMHTSL